MHNAEKMKRRNWCVGKLFEALKYFSFFLDCSSYMLLRVNDRVLRVVVLSNLFFLFFDWKKS